MGFIMVVASWPQEKSVDVGKVFLKMPKAPDFLKRVNVFLTSGPKSYTLYEAPNEKTYEALIEITKRYVVFQEVEGFKSKVKPLMEVKDALAMIGLG